MANKPINEYFSGLPKNSSPSSTTNLVVEENGVTKKVPIGSLPSGGGSGGGGASIIYATEKPSTPQQAIYVITENEISKVELMQGDEIVGNGEVVDTLPEVGIPAANMDTLEFYAYYLPTTNEAYMYVDEIISAITEGAFPVGWTTPENVAAFMGLDYGGVITSTEQATDEYSLYVLLVDTPITRVYIPTPNGAFLELTSGFRMKYNPASESITFIES